MKFVHIADMHFDQPFSGLNAVPNLSNIRRLEQRKVFKKVIDYIKENDIEYLFIAGDLFEQNYVRKSTIEYINQLFGEIPNSKIFIAPGNHDPYINNSYYKTFDWAKNVYICKSELEIIDEPEADIYMTAFTDFYMDNLCIDKIKIEKSDKLKILITHCDLNGGKDENGFAYAPIQKTKLNEFGFDYIAMGHIHKTNIFEETNLIYPGSPISFGFDEPGEHGMIVGEISKDKLKTEFVRLDDRQFEKYNLDICEISSLEALVEKISELELNEKYMYEIVLVGDRHFEINTREVFKLISNENILKIKDETQIGMDIEEIAKQNNLRGIFVREVIKKANDNYTEEQIKKAIEIGLEVIN